MTIRVGREGGRGGRKSYISYILKRRPRPKSESNSFRGFVE